MNLILALLLLLPTLTLPVERRGEVSAQLSLNVAESGPGPGLGRVRIDLRIDGPANVEIDGPRLEDALAAWRVRAAFASWSRTDHRDILGRTLHLEQVKPGAAPLPGVVLRVRQAGDADWQTVVWPDLLHETRDVPSVIELPPLPPSPWPRRLLVAGATIAVVPLVLFVVLASRRWRTARPQPEPLHVRMLARLERIEASPADQLDAVLREYLAQRLGVPTRTHTTSEIRAALAGSAIEAGELLAWADEVRFAGLTPSSEEITDRFARARSLITRTAAVPGEDGVPGEIGTKAEDG